MICTPRGESYFKNQGAHWLGWSRGCKLDRKHQAVPFSKHDEQNDAPERRSPANWKWRIFRRRPVTHSVILNDFPLEPTQMKFFLFVIAILISPLYCVAGEEIPEHIDLWRILSDADTIDVVSITMDRPADTVLDFHGYHELGRVTVTDKAKRKEILSSISSWKSLNYYNNRQAICFIPRHALHATHGDVSVDLLICFECRAHEWRLTINCADPEPAKTLLNSILIEAKVELARESAVKEPSNPKPVSK